jgi:hypothetical protein
MNRIQETAAGVALCAICLVGQSARADETSSSSIQTNSGAGSSTVVHHSASNAAGTASKTYKAVAGPGGAKVSATKSDVHANGDGSISANRQHESHTITAAGSAHHASNSNTTVGADGSTSTSKQEARTTTP